MPQPHSPHSPPHFPHSLPCFVISLAGSPRRNAVIKNLASVGITHPTIIDAVDGSALTPRQLRPFTESSRKYWFRRQLRPGAKGCSLSHIGIWQKMVDEGISAACIFEDDAEPIRADPVLLASRLTALISIRDRLDVVFLNNTSRSPVRAIPEAEGLGVMPRGSSSAEAYFITRRAAAYFLSNPRRFAVEIDTFMHQWWHHNSRDFHVLHSIPTLFKQADIPSQIGYHTPLDDKKGVLRGLLSFISQQYAQAKKRLLAPLYVARVRARFRG